MSSHSPGFQARSQKLVPVKGSQDDRAHDAFAQQSRMDQLGGAPDASAHTFSATSSVPASHSFQQRGWISKSIYFRY